MRRNALAARVTRREPPPQWLCGKTSQFALIRLIPSSQQPWSTYAVHITTLTAWALPTDLLLLYLLWRATELWPPEGRRYAMAALGVWMFVSKWIKLLGHFVRYPVDILFLPLSIAFGYFHGLLKLYAMVTLRVVSQITIFHSFAA